MSPLHEGFSLVFRGQQCPDRRAPREGWQKHEFSLALVRNAASTFPSAGRLWQSDKRHCNDGIYG